MHVDRPSAPSAVAAASRALAAQRAFAPRAADAPLPPPVAAPADRVLISPEARALAGGTPAGTIPGNGEPTDPEGARSAAPAPAPEPRDPRVRAYVAAPAREAEAASSLDLFG